MRSLLLILLVVFSQPAEAARLKPAKKPIVQSLPASAPKSNYDWQKVWLAPPAALLGFGLGHVVQNRFKGYPIVYPIVDGVGFLAIALSMGSCAAPNTASCQKKNDRMHDIGLGLLIASRIAQLIDVTIWSVNYEGDSVASVSIVPSTDGAVMAARFSF